MVDVLQLFALLEEAYLRWVRRWAERAGVEECMLYNDCYGWPAPIGGPVWPGIRYGVFDEFNELLKERGLRPMSWEEFRQLIDELLEYRRKYKLFGRFNIAEILAPNGRVEPHTITFYKPLFLRRQA